MMYKKKEIQGARKFITHVLKEEWVRVGDTGLEMTAKGKTELLVFAEEWLVNVYEMAVTV